MTPLARATLLALLLGDAAVATAQSWRLRFDASAQHVSFRGVTADSIPESQAQTGPTGGPVSPDGYAVTCFGDGFCRFYRAGPVRRGLPVGASADLTMWGLGLRGLSLHVNTRLLGDLTGDRLWPGTSPAVRLLEGYAEYVNGGVVARAGRMLEQGRLSSSGGGFDGGRISWSVGQTGLSVAGYLGWGLARGTVLNVSSPAVNPLLDFQPGNRQITAGVVGGLGLPALNLTAEYRREVDPATDYFVSERAALSLEAQPRRRLRFVGGATYDIAQGRWGSADATIRLSFKNVWASAGAKHYRPFFDLWTVWGVFSPVPYHALNGAIAVKPIERLELRGRAEWFRFDAADVSTPEVLLEDRGWRWALGATVTPAAAWRAELELHDELRPGASSRGVEVRANWRARKDLELDVHGGSLQRALELRFQDTGLNWLGAAADFRMGERFRVGASVDRYWESRDRPDAAAFDWNQWRSSLFFSLTLRSAADRWVLPPARRTGPTP